MYRTFSTSLGLVLALAALPAQRRPDHHRPRALRAARTAPGSPGTRSSRTGRSPTCGRSTTPAPRDPATSSATGSTTRATWWRSTPARRTATSSSGSTSTTSRSAPRTAALDLYLAIDAAAGGQSCGCPTSSTARPTARGSCACASTAVGHRPTAPTTGSTTPASRRHRRLPRLLLEQPARRGRVRHHRAALLAAGWNGSSPLTLPGVHGQGRRRDQLHGRRALERLADAFADHDRGCSDGVLNGAHRLHRHGRVRVVRLDRARQPVGEPGRRHRRPHLRPAAEHRHRRRHRLPAHARHARDLPRAAQHPPERHAHRRLQLGRAARAAPADPQDGPAFLARIRDFVDADQASSPGSLIGGVFAEHIMPYFEGPVNAASIALDRQRSTRPRTA